MGVALIHADSVDFPAAAPVALVAINPSGIVGAWPTEAKAMLGWDATEVEGLPLSDIIARRGDERALDGTFRRLLASNGSNAVAETVQVIAQRKDESTFPIEVTILSDGVRRLARLRELDSCKSTNPVDAESLRIQNQR
ncbi:MAG: domain S-box protein, partial [Capsulimonas sp.]|nr:domain S-box protein [Capsulimonas sp.]